VTAVRFDGRVAIVTGAGRGLGRAYAEALADRGASVVVNDVDADAAEAAASGIPGAIACAADVADARGAAETIDSAMRTFGRIDVVVANAGTSWHRPFDEMSADDLHSVLGPSLFGTFNTVRAAWPHLVAQRYGRVVTTASGAIFGFAGRAHYAAAKGAVLALTSTIAIEGAPHGVLANCVLPWGATRLSRPGGGAPDVALAAPPVVWLCHETCTENGGAFVTGGGRIARAVLSPGRRHECGEQTPEGYRDVLTTTDDRRGGSASVGEQPLGVVDEDLP
jgi:NAD(P)-dependent dehydrogenase (short-subunit alcohol dehydrogenase family)